MHEEHQQLIDRLEETHTQTALQIAGFNELLSKVRLRRGKHYSDRLMERSMSIDVELTETIALLRGLRIDLANICNEFIDLGSTAPEIIEGLQALNKRFEADRVQTAAKLQKIYDSINNLLVEGVL